MCVVYYTLIEENSFVGCAGCCVYTLGTFGEVKVDGQEGVQSLAVDSSGLRAACEARHGKEVCSNDSPLKYKRPKRACPFCGIFQVHLKRHIIRKHADETSVAGSISQSIPTQRQAFARLRKEGIYKKNRELIMRDHKCSSLHHEKRSRKDMPLSMCGNCKGFFKSAHLWRHKKNCYDQVVSVGSVVESSDLPANLLTKADDEDPEFVSDVLSHFRQDECGKLCVQDRMITEVGKRHYIKSSKKNRQAVLADMRRLGRILLECRKLENNDSLTGEQMLERRRFCTLEKAINRICCNGNDALKVQLGYLIRSAATVMKGVYCIEEEDEKATAMDQFLCVLKVQWSFVFGTAVAAVEYKRQEHTRKPSALPNEEDVQKVREYTLSAISNMLADSYMLWTGHEFGRLRDLIVCRLTLFNARRGGEPARMLLTQFQVAQNDEWIDKQLAVKITDPLQSALLGKFHVAYMSGKGARYMVPILVPNDLMAAINKLVSIRAEAGVHPNNRFVFASTQGSLNHVNGWHSVQAVCTSAGASSSITATKMRHRCSTMYALQELPENERSAFYRHMGHGKEVNQLVYQCPLAIEEVVKVGRFLTELDAGTSAHMSATGTSAVSSNVLAGENYT